MSHLDQFSTPFLPLVITGFLVSGMLVGLGGRWLLGRLRRGAVFHPPWCELSVAACWALAGWRWAVSGMPAWWLPVPLLLAAFGVCLAAVDLAQRRLPDALTLACYPALGGALAVAAALGPAGRLGTGALVGSALFGGAHALVHGLSPRSLGQGDVKLSGSLGAVLGALGWPALILAAALAAVITALLAAVTHSARGVPHGPGMLAATWLVAAVPGASLGR